MKIAFFGHDINESTIVKRITSFQRCGAEVISFTFQRQQRKNRFAPDWTNIDLGTTQDRRYFERIFALFLATIKIIQNRRLIAHADIFYARNIDMLLLAFLSRTVRSRNAIIVYEVLDVQRIFLGHGLLGMFMRRVERALARRCERIVVSSPIFISEYFKPKNIHSGKWSLLENKISSKHVLPSRPGRLPAPPWIIGWFGTLRCTRSLDQLCEIASLLKDRVQIRIAGLPSGKDLPAADLQNTIASCANIYYEGPYNGMGDLASLYRDVHFSWAIDYLDEGSNSDWLLPNRLYEGGACGVPAIARAGTATGLMVERLNMGVTFAEPLVRHAISFLSELSEDRYDVIRRGVVALPDSTFIDIDDTCSLIRELKFAAEQQRPNFAYGSKLVVGPKATRKALHSLISRRSRLTSSLPSRGC